MNYTPEQHIQRAHATLTVSQLSELLDQVSTGATLFAGPHASKLYKELAKKLHPDVCHDKDAKLATESFTQLVKLWKTKDVKPRDVLDFTTKKHLVQVQGLAKQDSSIYTVYDVMWRSLRDTTKAHALRAGQLKVANTNDDNDLLLCDSNVLKAVNKEVGTSFPDKAAYFPTSLEALNVKMPGVPAVQGHLTAHLTSLIGLDAVAKHYSTGLHPKDVAWMWRRALVGLGLVHKCGFVYGAAVLPALKIEPRHHGVVLDTFAYSVTIGSPLQALPTAFTTLYPPEVFSKAPVEPNMDLYVLGKTMLQLSSSTWPPALVSFAKGCCLARPSSRPQDAWLLLEELDELLQRLWGKRTFRPFNIPSI